MQLQLGVYYFVDFSVVPPSIDKANIVDNPRHVVGRTFILECPVDGDPQPTVTWMKNSKRFITFNLSCFCSIAL